MGGSPAKTNKPNNSQSFFIGSISGEKKFLIIVYSYSKVNQWKFGGLSMIHLQMFVFETLVSLF